MIISREIVAARLADHLRGDLSLAELVDWAEKSLCDGQLDPADETVVAAALARLGVADVGEFSLTWTECLRILADLGFRARLELEPA